MVHYGSTARALSPQRLNGCCQLSTSQLFDNSAPSYRSVALHRLLAASLISPKVTVSSLFHYVSRLFTTLYVDVHSHHTLPVRLDTALNMSTGEDVAANPFCDTYIELASLLPETTVVDDNSTKSYDDLAEVTENLQKTVLTEPVTVPVPTLVCPPPATHDSHSSQPSLNDTSAPVTSPASSGQDEPMAWRNCDLSM